MHYPNPPQCLLYFGGLSPSSKLTDNLATYEVVYIRKCLHIYVGGWGALYSNYMRTVSEYLLTSAEFHCRPVFRCKQEKSNIANRPLSRGKHLGAKALKVPGLGQFRCKASKQAHLSPTQNLPQASCDYLVRRVRGRMFIEESYSEL